MGTVSQEANVAGSEPGPPKDVSHPPEPWAAQLPGDRAASPAFLIGLAVVTLTLFAAAIWFAAPKPPYRPVDVGPPSQSSAQASQPVPGSSSDVSEPAAMTDEVQTLCEQGRELASKGMLEQALVPLLEARKLAPNSPEVHQYLSNVYYLSGQLEKALSEVEQAQALSPNQPLYQRNAAALRQELSRRGQNPGP